jgi:hypothetical protein
MIWLTWRQQRLETLLTGLALALAAALLVPIGTHMASVYTQSGVAACVAHHTQNSASCSSAIDAFQTRFEHASSLVPWLNLLPGLLGILLAAPLVLELEHGTYRLAWTQSVTRRRWLTIRFAAIGLGALLAALALTALMTWWREPLDHLQGRMGTNVFDFEGIVPYAYTLFAIALVVTIGAFTRRTVTAIGVSLLGFLALRISIQSWLREHYSTPLKSIWPAGRLGPANLSKSWHLHAGFSDRLGHPLANVNAIFAACTRGPKGGSLDPSCLRAHGVYNHAIYQPASRFWLFQGIEAGIFVGLALILSAAAVWWMKERLI